MIVANLITIGPNIESQPLNDNFAALNSAKVEKSGDTMTGLLTALGGIDLEVASAPTGKVGRMHANGATKQIYYHDGTDWRNMWHSGNNPASLAGNGYQKLASGLILQWGISNIPQAGGGVTFPITFPNALISVHPIVNDTTPYSISIYNRSLSGVGIIHGASGNKTVYWLAIGY